MTSIKQKKLTEERFIKVRSGWNASQAKNLTYIMKLSAEYEDQDIELAYRLMQYAYRIEPNLKIAKDKLTILRRKLKESEEQLTLDKIDELLDKEEQDQKQVEDNKSAANGKSITTFSFHEVIFSKLDFLPEFVSKSLFIFVIMPWLIYAFYLIAWASPRYESQSQIVVKQPDSMATLDTSMAILSGLGMPQGNSDSQLVKVYIASADMLKYLDKELSLREHYSSTSIDYFSGLHSWNSAEDFLAFYLDHILIEVDELSSVITVTTEAFEPLFAQKLNKLIVSRAEWFINTISQNLAKEQLKFIQGEHDLVANNLEKIKAELLVFQREHNVLDPEVTGIALQQIAYSLESNISIKKTELHNLRAIMSDSAPEIKMIKATIDALENQLVEENNRISGGATTENVASILATFSEYKIKLELAFKAYASSLVSLEKSRMEAYKKLQFLVVVESPTLPDDNKYPSVIYNLSLSAVILLLLFGIGQISIATIKELN